MVTAKPEPDGLSGYPVTPPYFSDFFQFTPEVDVSRGHPTTVQIDRAAIARYALCLAAPRADRARTRLLGEGRRKRHICPPLTLRLRAGAGEWNSAQPKPGMIARYQRASSRAKPAVVRPIPSEAAPDGQARTAARWRCPTDPHASNEAVWLPFPSDA
jgi:hypothetical protein